MHDSGFYLFANVRGLPSKLVGRHYDNERKDTNLLLFGTCFEVFGVILNE